MKKVLIIILVVAMLVVVIPTMAFAASTINVRTSVELNTAIATAADGDTIFVYNGTYALSQTIVDKNLIITGESESGVIITPTANTGSSGDSRGWIVVNDGFTLNLSNLTMDGTGFNIYQAIRAHGEVIADSITICNIKHSTYLGFGMALLGGSSVTNITMYGIERVGISIYGGDVRHDMLVNGFTYSGKGAVDGLDYAIEVGAMSGTAVPFQVDISNITISDNLAVASSDGSTSGGILITTYFYASGGGVDADLITVNIDHANINNCSSGVMVGYADAVGEYSITTITDSNFVNCGTDLDYVGLVTTGSFTTLGNYYGSGAPDINLGAGNMITGLDSYVLIPVPMNRDTEVTAEIDPTFMIIIPAAVDFGNILKDTGVQEQNFPVEAIGVLLEPGCNIDVTVTSPFVMKDEDGAGSVELAFAMNNESGAVLTGNTFATFTGNDTEDGSIAVNTDNITMAGSYKGTLVFAITYEN